MEGTDLDRSPSQFMRNPLEKLPTYWKIVLEHFTEHPSIASPVIFAELSRLNMLLLRFVVNLEYLLLLARRRSALEVRGHCGSGEGPRKTVD
jgi:hypothetical protein